MDLTYPLVAEIVSNDVSGPKNVHPPIHHDFPVGTTVMLYSESRARAMHAHDSCFHPGRLHLANASEQLLLPRHYRVIGGHAK